MHRTQVYITEEQRRRLAERAADGGVSRAEVLRRLLDEGLGVDDGAQRRRSAIRATAGIAAEEPDWTEWLRGVRGASAVDRLESLGD